MKKTISVFTALTTILWLVGAYMFLPVYGATFVDGDIARESDEFDVYIIKLVGAEKFKRLILNPDVFNMYGHLKWSNVKVVANGDLSAYTTSDLVRAQGDEKVYQLYPDGDTGTKKWVESLDCFTSKGFNWNSVYVINSFDRDSYTTASTTLCGAVTTGALTFSLASDTPGAATLPKNAYGVTFMKVKVEGSGKISQMTIKRSGAGSVDDFDNVYIYEGVKRLTSGRTISSATSKVTFIGLKINAPTTISIVADLSATAGNQDYFEILSASDVTADATVGGTFPLAGKFMSISGSDAGTLTVARSGSTAYNVTIGELEKEISAFKVTANTEGTKIFRVQLYNSGTATATKLINLKLKVGGNTVATADAFSSDGYAVFSLSTPYEILKGSHAIFYVYSDIAGKPDENIKLYLELATDILGTGTTFGYGMQATITDYDSDTYITATLVGGDLTLAKTGPNAANIGDNTSDTVFLEITMSAAADITINRTRLAWCADVNADGTYDTLVAAAGYFGDVEDVKITNKDTGVVWAGPHDGSAFTTVTSATTGGLCPGSVVGLYKDYTDTFDLSAGGSYKLKITADVKIVNTATEDSSELTAGDKIKIVWASYATLVGTTGNVNYVKYTNTTSAVDDSAIIPTADITSEEMTIQTAALAVTLAASPSGITSGTGIGTARKFVVSEQGVDVVGLVFTAGVASSVKVTALNLTGYIDAGEDGDGTYTAGKEGTSAVYVKDRVSSVEIWDTTANAKVPGSAAKGFSGTSYQTVAYTGLSWTIPAGEARTLLVKANLSSNTPSGSFDRITFDITTAASDITSQDKDANDITETGDAKNGGTAPGVAIGIYPSGLVYVKKANDTPSQSIITMGSTNNEVSKFRLTADRESFYIDTFTAWIDEDTASRSNFTGTALKYQTETQWGTSDWTISTKKTFGANASLSFTFEGSARPYAPKDDYGYITVLTDVNGYLGGQGAKAGDYLKFSANLEDSGVFKAYGAKSGKLLNGGDSGVYAEATNQGQMLTTGMNTHYIFRARPVFAKKAWSGDANELARFTITAQGYDVTFDGTSSDGFYNSSDSVVSASLEFDVIASGTDETDQTLYLYDWNNSIISSITELDLSLADIVTENANAAATTTISFQFEEATAAVVIAKDVTREFYITIDNLVDFNNQDEYIQLRLLNDQGTLATGTVPDRDNTNIVWYDGTDDESTMFTGTTALEHAMIMPANTKGIGEFPFSFRYYVGTAQ